MGKDQKGRKARNSQKGSKKRPAQAGRSGQPGASQPLAALYHLDEGTPRGDAVRAVLAGQGIRAKTVAESQLGSPVGAIAGLRGFKLSAQPYDGDVPEGEFMLLVGLSSERTGRLLSAMREADASVGCKAQLTEHNRLWPFAVLVQEVSREHALMSAQRDGLEADARR